MSTETDMRESLRMQRIDGVDTAVHASGDPDSPCTVVFVHGGDVRSLSNAGDWSTVWDPAAVGARLIAYDKPGQGRSRLPDDGADAATFAGLVAHLKALVATISGPVVLVGHSRGALPVARVALDDPERIHGLVLVSSNTLAPVSSATPVEFYARAYADPPELLDAEYVRREPVMNSFDDGHVDDAFVRWRLEAAGESGWWDDRGSRSALYPRVLDSLRDGREAVLADLERRGFGMPVLQVWGRDDVSAPPELGDRLLDLITRRTEEVTAMLFHRSGHYVYREHPASFVRHLGAFVAGLGARPRPGPIEHGGTP